MRKMKRGKQAGKSFKTKEELATITNATISVLAEQGDDFVEELESFPGTGRQTL